MQDQQAHAAFAALSSAGHEHADVHEKAAHALTGAAPAQAKASMNDLITRARAANVPWGKIFAAITIAAAGGFTPQSIAAAIASLFGNQPAPAKP